MVHDPGHTTGRNQDMSSPRAKTGDVFLAKRGDSETEPLLIADGKSKSEQTFEVGIISTFTEVREDLERTARETDAYVVEILDLLGQLEEVHLHKHSRFEVMKEHPNMNKDKFDSLFSTYSSLLNELGPWRMQVIQEGEEAAQVQSVQMRKSRKGMMNVAKRRLDEGREKQQLATDASELMKHYKALIMAA